LSPTVLNETKSKQRKHTRSISPGDKHHSRYSLERGRDEKSKHREGRRSRSISADDKDRKGSRKSLKHADESKSGGRRPSRSKSIENDDNNIEENKDGRLKHNDRIPAKSDYSFEDPDSRVAVNLEDDQTPVTSPLTYGKSFSQYDNLKDGGDMDRQEAFGVEDSDDEKSEDPNSR